MRILERQYKLTYSLDIYEMKCTAHTLNNVVADVLHYLLSSKKDDIVMRNAVNDNDNDEIEEDERNAK